MQTMFITLKTFVPVGSFALVRPWKHVYDSIILHYMIRQQIHFTKYNKKPPFSEFVPVIGRYMSYTYSPQSVSRLCRAIEKNEYGKEAGLGQLGGYPGINRATVRRHLRKLVKKQVVVKLRWARRWKNETLYRIHPNMMYLYSDYLLTLLTHGKLSIAEKDRLLSSIL
jgi:hypothetical protein